MMMKRMFEIRLELVDSQVTLSPSLVAHMIKHNRYNRASLRVLPMTDKAEGGKRFGLDINPPYTICSSEYQQTLAEVQYDPKSHESGFMLEDPTVTGVLYQYGMWTAGADSLCKQDKDGKVYKRMNVEARKMAGRWVYWLLPEPLTDKEAKQREKQMHWTLRFQRWHIW